MKNTCDTDAPISDRWGQEFANNWLTAWNLKDVDKIVEFYSDEVVLVSPTVKEVTGRHGGITVIKSELREMLSKVFQQIPELHYSLVAVAVGIDSLTIYFTSSLCDMVADVLKFDNGLRITKSYTYY